jgi:hypothetical protein
MRHEEEYQGGQQFAAKEAGKCDVCKAHDKEDSTPRDNDVNEAEILRLIVQPESRRGRTYLSSESAANPSNP